jgi:hypothetical protein
MRTSKKILEPPMISNKNEANYKVVENLSSAYWI